MAYELKLSLNVEFVSHAQINRYQFKQVAI